MHWGAGFHVGAYYTWESWGFGASFKSPQWFETFRYQATDELGHPRNLKLRFDYPMIVSLGAAYSGFDRFLFALDVRYVDYRNTKGFGPAGFDATGAVTGVGWDSVVLVAAGVQYRLSEAVSLRMGSRGGVNHQLQRAAFEQVHRVRTSLIELENGLASQSGRGKRGGGASRGDELEAEFGEPPRHLHGFRFVLVVHAEEDASALRQRAAVLDREYRPDPRHRPNPQGGVRPRRRRCRNS